VDQSNARILKKLEDSGQADNTIIVFTSDHGEMMGTHSLIGKSVFYEEAIRIPLFLRVPFRQRRKHAASHQRRKAPRGSHLRRMAHAAGRPDRPHGPFAGWLEAGCLRYGQLPAIQSQKDPLELSNLYFRNESAAVMQRLRPKVEAWQKGVGDHASLTA
jgi:hypothetical protein